MTSNDTLFAGVRYVFVEQFHTEIVQGIAWKKKEKRLPVLARPLSTRQRAGFFVAGSAHRTMAAGYVSATGERKASGPAVGAKAHGVGLRVILMEGLGRAGTQWTPQKAEMAQSAKRGYANECIPS